MDLALKALQRDYWGALLRDGLMTLGDIDAAKDAVQDTLIRAWRSCASYRGESELFPWLRKILRHLAIDELRRRRSDVELEDEQGVPTAEVEAALERDGRSLLPRPDEAMWESEVKRVYHECAARFAADHPLAANVIRWVAEDELDMDDVSALLQRTPGATREFISQCRKKARVYFLPWFEALKLKGGAQ